jgi:hypothetical protein
MPLSLKFKLQFFDRRAVIRAMGARKRAALSRIGSFVRTRAKSLIRSRKGVAKPGQPPSSHVGTLKGLIFFGYDFATQSAVVGPVRFGTGDAPNLLEFGGVVLRKDRNGRRRVERYHGNPFMGPSLRMEISYIPQHWQNSVK